jgi:hypothetical protein
LKLKARERGVNLFVLSVPRHASLIESTHFNLIRRIVTAQMRFRLRVAVSLLLLSTFLSGCASMAARGLFPEVEVRKAPDVVLGTELTLLEEQAKLATSLVDTDGGVHLFVTDKKKQLHHIEIQGDMVFTRELLGVIETNQGGPLDAVERPPGKLRVLAGDTQYVRTAPGQGWQEIKGNRCTRFVPVGDHLFCAFVIKGEEVATPKRTDVTYGWFFLVPVVFWSNKQASKLVVAQESADGWTIRAVLDSDTIRDADRDFMVGTDNLGTLHFLYGTSRGGGFFFVAAGGYTAAGGFQGPDPELRYAQVAIERLLAPPMDSQNQQLRPSMAAIPWLPIQGTFLSGSPSGHVTITGEVPWGDLRPYDRHFAVNKASGEVSGLIRLDRGSRLDDGVRKLGFGDFDNAWVEVRIRDGSWAQSFDVAATKDLPDSTFSWDRDTGALIMNDPNGNTHALLEHVKRGFWKTTSSVDYFVKKGANWSAALTLGSSRSHWDDGRVLAVDNTGAAFAAWVNSEGKFVGRWIRSSGKSFRSSPAILP